MCDLISKGQSPSDYIAVLTTQTFTSGSRNGATRCIEINIVDDNIFEGTQYFVISLELTMRNPHVLLDVAATNITILDFDGMCNLLNVTLSEACYLLDVSVSLPAVLMASEGDEEVQVCATLSAKENIEASVTITIATSIILTRS